MAGFKLMPEATALPIVPCLDPAFGLVTSGNHQKTVFVYVGDCIGRFQACQFYYFKSTLADEIGKNAKQRRN